MRIQILSSICLLTLNLNSFSQALFHANFEEHPVTSALYYDTEDPSLPHPLTNNPDQPLLNVDALGPALGYQASYIPYDQDSTGFGDGDHVGITDSQNMVGAFSQGNQGYIMSDIDVNFILTFSEVDLNGMDQITVSCDAFINQASYEGDGVNNASNSDRIAIYIINPETGDRIDLINSTGQDINDLNIEGRWLNLSANLSGFNRAQLVIEARNNASDEAFFIDNIKFEGQLGLTGPNHSNSRVVPNPVTTNFSISSRPFDLRAIYIKNIFGRTVWRGSSEHSAWEISHLNSGLYFLNIERDNSTWTQKIIKN